MEPGETLARAARRETREETGFEVRIETLFHTELFNGLTKRGKPKPEVGVFFHCVAPATKSPSIDPAEHTAYAWVRKTDLDSYPALPHLSSTVRAAFLTRPARGARRREPVRARKRPTFVRSPGLPVPA